MIVFEANVGAVATTKQRTEDIPTMWAYLRVCVFHTGDFFETPGCLSTIVSMLTKSGFDTLEIWRKFAH